MCVRANDAPVVQWIERQTSKLVMGVRFPPGALRTNMYPDSDDGLNRETSDAVYFFTPAFHPLDNFSAHAIRVWGRDFPTVEHAFQWKKFSGTLPDVAEKVANAKSPHVAQGLARLHPGGIPEAWRTERVDVMRELLRAKTEQHDDVKDVLTKTGSRVIIENSPVDGFWGIGPDGKGENMIGKIWMEIRKSITPP